VAATPAPAPAQGAIVETSPIGSGTTPTQGPGAFEPVDGTQVTSEPLPADNLPAPLPDPID
jgi:hypothetical protein